MLSEERARMEKRALAPLKEQITHFLYRKFIDFERDKHIDINGIKMQPSFYLNKQGIVIDCMAKATVENPEFEKRKSDYEKAELPHLFFDLRNLEKKDVEFVLESELSRLGVNVD